MFIFSIIQLSYISVGIMEFYYKIGANGWFFVIKSLVWRRCAKPEAHFSSCWCLLLTTNLLTWTGIGTTIFPALLPLEHFGLLRDTFPPMMFFCESLHAVVDKRLALTRFHFARRFWNHIFTWKHLPIEIVKAL